MSVVSDRVKRFLDDHFVCYEMVPHITDFTSSETAEHTHTPGGSFAKAVVIDADRKVVMVVLPSHHIVDLNDLEFGLGVEKVGFVPERKLRRIFSDCDPGAIPPFGNLYGMRVFLSHRLHPREITFNAGSHEMVIRMSFDDYCSLVRPKFLAFSHVP